MQEIDIQVVPREGKRLRDYVFHGIFFSVWGMVKYLPSPIGDIFRYILAGPVLHGKGWIRISEGVTLWYPYNIFVGRKVTFNQGVFISGFGGLVIGNGVRIGHRTSIITSNHNYEDTSVFIYKQGLSGAPVIIEDDVFIGAHAVILPGVRIGRGAVISAGSVVNHNVKPYRVVGGVPAVTIQNRLKNRPSGQDA